MSRSGPSEIAHLATAAPRVRMQVVNCERPIAASLVCKRCKRRQVFAFGYHALYLWVADLEAIAAECGWAEGVCEVCRLAQPLPFGTSSQEWLVFAYNRTHTERARVKITFPGPVNPATALAAAVGKLNRMVDHRVLDIKHAVETKVERDED